MKKIFYLLVIIFAISCASVSSLPKVDAVTGYKIVYWCGNDMLLEIKDTADGSRFEPIMLKHASKRQLKKLYPDQNNGVSKVIYFNQ